MTPHLETNTAPRFEQRRAETPTTVELSIDLSTGYFGRHCAVIKEVCREMPWLFEGAQGRDGVNFPSIRSQLLNAIIDERTGAVAA